MSAFFVTATGTDIGKTFVAAGLIRHWRAAGRAVDALKPVTTGFDLAEAAGSDAGVLLKALGRPVTVEEIERISPWRYAAPLSPDVASAARGALCRSTSWSHSRERAIANACRQAADRRRRRHHGAARRPHTVLDWMTALHVPLVLVTGSYLGTLSHTLTCLDVLKRRELAVKALVVNETPGSSVPMLGHRRDD